MLMSNEEWCNITVILHCIGNCTGPTSRLRNDYEITACPPLSTVNG